MKRFLTLMLAAAALCACTPTQKDNEMDLGKIDTLCESIFPDGEPGGAVLVMQGDSVIYRNCRGVADIVTGAPITDTTLFNIASVSKQFTAVGILQLVSLGMIGLDDCLHKYFPEFRSHIWDRVLIRHLLSHSSGVPDERGYLTREEKIYGDEDLATEYMKELDHLNFEPGSDYEYINPTFVLLGKTIERVSGQPFTEYMEENVLGPAGMTSSHYFDETLMAGLAECSHGYEYVDVEDMPQERTAGSACGEKKWYEYDYGEETFFATRPDGGLYSSLQDFVRWELALRDGRLLDPALLDRAHTPQTRITGSRWSDYQNRPNTWYGYGWFIEPATATTPHVIYHTGDNGGYKILAARYPEAQTLVLIFSNRADWDRYGAKREIEYALGLARPVTTSFNELAAIPAAGARDVCPDTHLAITFPSEPMVGSQGFVRIFDATTSKLVDSLDLSIPAGPSAPRSYPPDIDYTKIPYDYSRTATATNRTVVAGTPSGTAEPTPHDCQLTIIGGFTDGFHFRPIIVNGCTATIYPHNNMLENDHRYYVTIDDGVLQLADGSFKGVTKRDGWIFSTRKKAPAAGKDTLIVDCTGNGDFNTVQGALDHLPDFSDTPVTIFIRPGDYEEIVYARNKANVTIKGAGRDLVKVHYANNEVFNPHPMTVKTNERPGTFPERRAAFALDNCRDIRLEGLTIATDLTGQAEGLLVNGERFFLRDIHIIGSGDALQANGTIYMEECDIDGGADTILGRGSLFALRCNLRNDGGPFTWVRNTEGIHGDVFVECTFSSPEGTLCDYGRSRLNHGSYYPFAEVVVIDCRVRNLLPEGWSELDRPSATMLEFNTTGLDDGKPVDVSRRHPVSRQLDAIKDAGLIGDYRSPAFVLGGWDPYSEL